LTIAEPNIVSGGTVTLNSDGSISLTPDATANTATFTYVANDGI